MVIFRKIFGKFKIVRLIEQRTRRFRSKFFTYTALNSLDKRIEPYLPSTGFFVEAGANDGLKQSNTFFLEKKYSWIGILIEPIPRLFNECQINRPKSKVVNCALVSEQDSGKSFEIVDVDLMSSLKSPKTSNSDDYVISSAEKILGINRKYSSVIGRSLTNVLSELSAPKEFEFLSLDVEGFEFEVLAGLDLSQFKPNFILIETSNIQTVLKILKEEYSVVEKLSNHDYFLKSIN